MPYIQTEVTAGKVRYVRKSYTAAHHPRGTRAKKENQTKDAQKRVNQRQREITLWLRIEANFGHGDSHTALHYFRGSEPEDIAQAEADLTAAIKRAGLVAKRQGVPFRWIAVTETKGTGRDIWHHHVIVNREARDILWDAWEWTLARHGRQGKASDSRIDQRPCHRQIAAYLLKHSEVTADLWRELGKTSKSRWRASRNLVVPKAVRRIVTANTWAREPKARKGCYLLKTETGADYACGVNEMTGWPWMEYVEVLT